MDREVTGRVGRSEIEEAIGEYIADLQGKRYSPITLQGYSRVLRRFASVAKAEGTISLSSLPDEVERFISNLRLDRYHDRLAGDNVQRKTQRMGSPIADAPVFTFDEHRSINPTFRTSRTPFLRVSRSSLNRTDILRNFTDPVSEGF